MKTKSLLVVSILLNLLLVGVTAHLLKSGPVQAPQVTTPKATVTNEASRVVTRKALVPYAVTNTVTFDWRKVESDDYRKYIANLRAVGCPEETIRDIIVADVNKLFAARRKELNVSTNKLQYWKAGNPLADMFDEEKIKKQQELAAEKRALLKELLGVEANERPDLASAYNPYEAMLDFLPAEKQTQLMELEQKFAARLMKNMKDIQKGDFTAMRQVQTEKEAEMAKFLSPEEKEAYDLRLSQTAVIMRMQMSDFQPTEQEFVNLFRLRKKFDDEFGPYGVPPTDKAQRERRDLAQKELDNQMKDALGADRFREYKYDPKWNSSSLRGVAEEYNVPKETAFKVFDIQAVSQEQATKIRADTSLSAEQRQSTLDAVRAETEKAIGEIIGQPALKAYVEKGSWIKNLNRATTGGGSN